ncbi:phosphatases II [Favolaschia claudopus]|uniref:phosphatidylinositol-3,4,5-trisphosphate 3-phosphatase n=1 Tax=Favolaschia claudopus TaxID=2862362 RepID=A0AAW0AZK9_9AGAR
MLPFGLKVAWFVLTIVGTVFSVLSVMALGRLVGNHWTGLGYSFGMVLYQGMFCLGMIWKMDPYRMPRAFCLAQTILMSLGYYIIWGFLMVFCFAVCVHILKPKEWGDLSKCFHWRLVYYLPALGFPVAAIAVRVVLILKYDAVHPFDGFNCDASHPIWVRLGGYAFPSIVVLVPTTFMSLLSARHMHETLNHIKRAMQDDNELPRQMRMERRSGHHSLKHCGPVILEGDDAAASAGRQPIEAPPEAVKRPRFHLPFFTQLQSARTLTPSPQTPDPTSTSPYEGGRSSVASSSFPTFAPINDKHPFTAAYQPEAPENDAEASQTWVDDDSSAPRSFEAHETTDALELDVKDQDDDDTTYRLSYRENATPSRISHIACIPLRASEVQRLFVCQVSVPIFTFLSIVSMLAEGLTHPHEPRPINTLNVVQLLAAWMATIFLGMSRFKDGQLNLELDLVYLTDRVIIMGYPAEGFESFYRNNREDAKRQVGPYFLEHRHGKNFWVFNFCPIRENSYSADFFDGRVSRYPFPDHHAPPLAIMPLAAREMAQWLDGSPDRVIVLHCKAGKGRSGTLACTYLLSLGQEPTPPKLERSHTASEWAKVRANDVMEAIEHEEDANTLDPVDEAAASTTAASQKSFTESLKTVLDLHTARRMKPPGENEKPKQGVSIPSQRRWLHYWALLLAHEAPAYLWPAKPPAQRQQQPRVRLTQIKVRMREPGAVKMHLVRAATAVMDRTNMGKAGAAEARGLGNGSMWVSLARYDDDFVRLLEKWELHTRDEGGNMGRLKKDAGALDGETLRDMFSAEGKWDKHKMVRSFARLGATSSGSLTKEVTEDGKISTYTLHPLSESGWVNIRDGLPEADAVPDTDDIDIPASEANSMYEVTHSARERGVVLDAGREVRVKLYMGQVFICWLWFIPAFHMNQPPPNGDGLKPPPTKFTLTRKEADFPLGVGSALIDVEIEMEWLKTTDSEGVQPPARQTSVESAAGEKGEPAGISATVEALAAGNVAEAVEAKQAAED